MTAALLEHPNLNGSCRLPWCMRGWERGHNCDDVTDGLLHYGRPSSVESYEGDAVTVVPFQFNDDVDSTGPRVEVGAHSGGHHQVPLTPSRAFEFAALLYAATQDDLSVDSTIEVDGGRKVTVYAGKSKVRHGLHDYWLVQVAFFEPNDGKEPAKVEMLDVDAAEYARFVEAAAVEVTR